MLGCPLASVLKLMAMTSLSRFVSSTAQRADRPRDGKRSKKWPQKEARFTSTEAKLWPGEQLFGPQARSAGFGCYWRAAKLLRRSFQTKTDGAHFASFQMHAWAVNQLTGRISCLLPVSGVLLQAFDNVFTGLICFRVRRLHVAEFHVCDLERNIHVALH